MIDIATRPGVTQRFLYIAPDSPKAAVILYAGGHGGLQLDLYGTFDWGQGNFLVRTRQIFGSNGLAVAVIDAPSDRQSAPFLIGFRLSAEHAADGKAVIAWMREHAEVPVWLVGTSRGTQSVAAIAIALANGGGLTSTILRDDRRGSPVTSMNLSTLKIPVLVVHHRDDACRYCPVSETSGLMEKLTGSSYDGLMIVSGGNAKGDPCEAFSYHGFNGVEGEVVHAIAEWIAAH
ncbi:alpha/beta hydrolase family protein [Paraburkholderia elongata]|uniref:alpha/beta hydrolase family protein n=1 Tax=Paraburkholderia elongata TaxID=2675747 RepID=UPI002E2D9F11|nr:alpha/beta hydrolase [Paraburkholderia elongata]